jgi:hypothetical protein
MDIMIMSRTRRKLRHKTHKNSFFQTKKVKIYDLGKNKYLTNIKIALNSIKKCSKR